MNNDFKTPVERRQQNKNVIHPTVPIFDDGEGRVGAHGNSLSNLCACVVGVITAYVVYQLILENMLSQTGSVSEIGLILLLNIVNTAFSSIAIYSKARKPLNIPLHKAARISLCMVAATWCSNRALRYISIPTQTIAKACKPLPTMILGMILGRKYNRLQYLSTLVICCGVTIFNLASAVGKKNMFLESSDQLQGLLFIIAALILDGATGAYEDLLVKEMKWKHDDGNTEATLNLMYYINLTAIPMSLSITVSMEGLDGIKFVFSNFSFCIALATVGAIGQLFIFHTISTNGSLTCCIITTCRKMFTVILSVVIFKHLINEIQIAAILLTFFGLGLDIHQKLLASKTPFKPYKLKTAAIVA